MPWEMLLGGDAAERGSGQGCGTRRVRAGRLSAAASARVLFREEAGLVSQRATLQCVPLEKAGPRSN